MRPLPLILLVIVAAIAVYFLHPATRETVRQWTASPAEKDKFAAYNQGKAILVRKWPGASAAKFTAWGDEPSVGATQIDGDLWRANGQVQSDTTVPAGRQPWIVVFRRLKDEVVTYKVGAEADELIESLQTGKKPVATAIKEATATPAKSTPVPTPKPGEWMFKGYKPPLEQKPKKSR